LVAGEAIAVGDKFRAENLTIKRPGTGLSPMNYWHMLGRSSDRSYQQDELLE
jgi:N-acetylneuraminate synthase